MSTNYYLRAQCPHCKQKLDGEEGPHIGKSSGGWRFILRIYPRGIPDGTLENDRASFRAACHDPGVTPPTSWAEWLPLLEQFGVIDEYERGVHLSDFIKTVTDGTLYQRAELRMHTGEGIIQGPEGSTYDLYPRDFS